MGKNIVVAGFLGLALSGAWFSADTAEVNASMSMQEDVEWKTKLSPGEFCVMREKGTEAAFSGKYWNHHEVGTYLCKGCGAPLFQSGTKYNSGSGWPSFWQPIDSTRLHFSQDTSWGMLRTEVSCARCGGHLGHVFEDGPRPTGKRFCINSASLDFQSAK